MMLRLCEFGSLTLEPAWRSLCDSPATWRRRAFEKTLLAAELILLAVTWKLWTPQTAFPQVPLIGWTRDIPVSLEWCGGLLLVGALAVGLLAESERASRWAMALAAVAMLGLIAVDQLRLQAWAWQFLLLALAWTALPSREAWGWLRLLAISLYVFSALSKLNPEFLATLGPRFVEQGLQFVGLSMASWSDGLRTAVVLALPLGELLVGVGLVWPAARRWAVLAAVLMHALLIAVLSPWGMKHSAGVLVWNLFFIAQVILLFGGRAEQGSTAQVDQDPVSGERTTLRARGTRGFARVLLGLAVVLPIVEPWGWWDAWPSWGLYSARNERTEVYLSAENVSRLKGPVRRFVDEAADEAGERRLRLDAWCLDALGVPITPQHRQQLGVVRGLADRFLLSPEGVRCVRVGAASYGTGERRRQEVRGDDLRESAGQFWLGAAPRGNLQRP